MMDKSQVEDFIASLHRDAEVVAIELEQTVNAVARAVDGRQRDLPLRVKELVQKALLIADIAARIDCARDVSNSRKFRP